MKQAVERKFKEAPEGSAKPIAESSGGPAVAGSRAERRLLSKRDKALKFAEKKAAKKARRKARLAIREATTGSIRSSAQPKVQLKISDASELEKLMAEPSAGTEGNEAMEKCSDVKAKAGEVEAKTRQQLPSQKAKSGSSSTKKVRTKRKSLKQK